MCLLTLLQLVLKITRAVVFYRRPVGLMSAVNDTEERNPSLCRCLLLSVFCMHVCTDMYMPVCMHWYECMHWYVCMYVCMY